MIFGGGANPGLRVNSAAQVVVQIAALGHAEEKVAKLKRVLTGGFETQFGAALAGGLNGCASRGCGLRCGGQKREKQNGGEKEKLRIPQILPV